MSSEKIKWYKTPPYSNIVGGLSVLAIAGVLRLAYEWVAAPTALTTIKNFWDLTISSFSFILNYEFKLWWLILFGIWIVVFRFLRKVDKLNKESKPSFYVHPDSIPIEVLDKMSTDIERDIDEQSYKESKLLDYKADKFDLVIWRWYWIYNNLIKAYEPKEISPACTGTFCEHSPMEFSNRSSFVEAWYTCLKCGKNTPINVREGEIELLINKKTAEILN